MADVIVLAGDGRDGQIHVAPELPSQLEGETRRESTDDSTLTSVMSETFDRVPDAPGTSMTKVDVNGILRYSSTDAAEDTGLSSVSSNGRSEDKKTRNEIITTPNSSTFNDGEGRARKRLALSPTMPTSTSKPTLTNNPHTMSSSLLTDLHSFDSPSTESYESSNINVSFKARKVPRLTRLQADVRPSSSIPSRMSWEEYGRQCILAAHSSRLNPYALHPSEYRLLRDRIAQSQVTTYLNIRNGILRLWTRNPMVSVSQEEAVGCAKETRFFELAHTAYKWLVRNGYINFGCVEVPRPVVSPPRGRRSTKQKTIAVIGAGMSGLGCARQLEGLIAQLADHWVNQGEPPPRVVVIEGRKRIGGRVYSHPLRSQVTGGLPDNLRNTAEMGAQIITGFEHGNPLNAIIRGQLGLRYHLMWDEIVMHDSDGRAVNHERDMLVNKIHNDILERTSDYRIKPTTSETLEGLQDYIDVCQEPVADDSQTERAIAASTAARAVASVTGQDKTLAVPPGFAKLQGRTQVVAGNSSSRTAAQAARSAGWELRPGISRNHSLSLNKVARATDNPTLGATMDEAVRQYQNLVELTPQDMRMLNWHYADLEYANAATVSKLSLGGHDQDTGNEFEGRHSEVVGGYIQVPRGLMMLPHRLDVRFGCVVKNIRYTHSTDGEATVECTNGEVIEADKIVLTSPLGVLKANTIAFNPPLPDWKRGAIDRMGFGLLNKVVLVYERPFWNEKYDMFGMLNEAEKEDSMDPKDYANKRGRFYLIWNCVNNSGRPMLIALMAGRAAHDAEITDTQTLLQEVTTKLSGTFAPQVVPAPVEVIVTRWKKDPFTRGTYSFVSPDTKPGDYDVMATPVGNLHFAGEATCGTHPATVHGAYLSGLRAAAEVVESLIGPIDLPQNIIGPKQDHPIMTPTDLFSSNEAPAIRTGPLKIRLKNTRPHMQPQTIIKQEEPEHMAAVPAPQVNPYRSSNNSRSSSDEEREALIISAILSEIGHKPLKPARPGVNPFLVYTAQHWNECKESCSAELQKRTGKPDAKATRNEIRIALGKQWRNASDEVKKPYLNQCEAAQQVANEARAQYEQDVTKWNENARRIRMEFMKNISAGFAN